MNMKFYNGITPLQTMIWLLLILLIPGGLNQDPRIGTALFSLPVCDDGQIRAEYESPLPKRQNQYKLSIPIPAQSFFMILKFDSEASIVLKNSDPMKFVIKKLSRPRYSFRITFRNETSYLSFQVFGPEATGTIPYVQSVLVDYKELCKSPKTGYFDSYIEERIQADEEKVEPEINTDEINPSQEESCGKRKVVHTELIVHGQTTKSGDWPWHVAILRVEKSFLRYLCGGTLLSKTLVLTAAHCASIRGNAVVPDSLSVELGKYNLNGGDVAAQERGVFEIIIHPKFDVYTLDNDIALLKLKSEVVFTDYVQPACLWNTNSKLPTEDVFGTVVGWGFNHQDILSSTLQQITIPIVSELVCLKSNPVFFHKKLNTNKFCAGFANGTSVCNGDSGGGLMVFVSDRPGATTKASGSWYVRGIVSLSPSRTDAAICDPHEYTIFTDVDKYQDWVLKYLN